MKTAESNSALPLNDPRWQSYSGGYKLPYDASVLLKRLLAEGPSDALWDEFWQELYHQGSVGPASYAVVPHLLNWEKNSERLHWQVFSLVAGIELARSDNEQPPSELEKAYYHSIAEIPSLVGEHQDRTWDQLLTTNIVTCIALARNQRVLGEAYYELDESMARRLLTEEFGREDSSER